MQKRPQTNRQLLKPRKEKGESSSGEDKRDSSPRGRGPDETTSENPLKVIEENLEKETEQELDFTPNGELHAKTVGKVSSEYRWQRNKISCLQTSNGKRLGSPTTLRTSCPWNSQGQKALGWNNFFLLRNEKIV